MKRSIVWVILVSMLAVLPLAGLASTDTPVTGNTGTVANPVNQTGSTEQTVENGDLPDYAVATVSTTTKVYDRFGTAYNPIEVINAGEKVQIMEVRGGLAKVLYGDGSKCGWISVSLLTF